MIELVYKIADDTIARTFESSEALVNWLKSRCLIEKVTIIKIRDRV